MDQLAELAQTIDQTATRLREIRRAVEDGATPDLGGVDGEINRLCEAVARLHPTHAQSLVPALELMLGEVDALSKEVGRQHASLRDGLQNVGVRRQAVTAYSKAPNAGSGPKR